MMDYDKYRMIQATMLWENIKGQLNTLDALHGARYPSTHIDCKRIDKARVDRHDELERIIYDFIEVIEESEFHLPM